MVNQMEDEVPVIDFAGLEGDQEQRKSVSRQVAEACQTWGFFQIVNHGTNPELMKRSKQVSKEFFYLPEQEKMKIKVGPGNIRGWNHSKLTGATGDNELVKPDTVEHIFLAQFPDDEENAKGYPLNPPSYRATILEYAGEIRTLHSKILSVMWEMLGLSAEQVEKLISVEHMTMRTNFYPLRKESDPPGGVCHPHSDPGGITILLADDVSGLQVKKDGRWVQVDPVPGAFIVNVGDSAEIMSNGTYKSVEHRGMPNQTQERLTIASFSGPMLEDEVGPLDEILSERNPPRYRRDIFRNYIRSFHMRGLDGKNGLDAYKLL
ncbi:hypothetical protein R1sor_007224 [Riccia sorocarpa]|uniref:Fe2OG dioxygenase domain-containing protein n=1 Tax=Riccia sorocarpa TaxID=122646 RepID=A0ABD3HPU0_9MARC